MYEVIVGKQVIKQLEKIPLTDYKRIKSALINLTSVPRPQGYLKLKGRDAYRIRVGNYRIIYEIKDDKLIVLIITIAHRKDVYD